MKLPFELSPAETKDTVNLAVPPVERMAKVIRMATIAVASRTGLTIDQVDDVSTAVDELFHRFQSRRNDSEFCVRFEIQTDRLVVLAEGCAGLVENSGKMGRYHHFLLESLSDSLEEVPNPEGGADVVLVKMVVNP